MIVLIKVEQATINEWIFIENEIGGREGEIVATSSERGNSVDIMLCRKEMFFSANLLARTVLTCTFKNCSHVCMYHCAKLSYTIKHRTVLLIDHTNLQININAPMLFSGMPEMWAKSTAGVDSKSTECHFGINVRKHYASQLIRPSCPSKLNWSVDQFRKYRPVKMRWTVRQVFAAWQRKTAAITDQILSISDPVLSLNKELLEGGWNTVKYSVSITVIVRHDILSC